MKRTRENIDKLSLYELRNFTAIVFSVLLIAGSILSILGYAMTNIPRWFNLALLIWTLVWFSLVFFHRITLATLLSACIFGFTVELASEALYMAIEDVEKAQLYITADTTQALTLIFLSLLSLNKRLIVIVGCFFIFSWTTICLILKEALWDVYVINAVIFAGTTYFGYFAIHRIIYVYTNYHDLTNERDLMQAMQHMDRNQINAIIKLGMEKNQTPEETQRLLHAAGADAQQIINDNVSAVVRQQMLNEQLLTERLPELTMTELQVAKSILMKLQLSEMMKVTGKSKGNITTIRSRIRHKLGANAGEQLYNVLFQRVYGTLPRSMKL